MHDVQNVRRQFFIPRDWASTESLKQCRMLEDGTFLCPTDGEVATIKNDLNMGSRNAVNSNHGSGLVLDL